MTTSLSTHKIIIVLTFTILAALGSSQLSFAQPVQVDTSTTGAATGYAPTRHNIYDASTKLFWTLYHNGLDLKLSASADGKTWTKVSTLRVGAPVNGTVIPKWTSTHTVLSGKTYLFVAAEDGYDIVLYRTILGNKTATFSAKQVVLDGNSFSDRYMRPAMALDDSLKLWIAAVYINSDDLVENQRLTSIQSSSLATDSTVSWGVLQQFGKRETQLGELFLFPQTGSKMYLLVNSEKPNLVGWLNENGTWSKTNAMTGGERGWFTFWEYGGVNDLPCTVKPEVRTTAVDSSQGIYLGGNFKDVGSSGGDYVVRWDGSVWDRMGSNIDAPVNVLEFIDGSLYAGGEFSKPSKGVARWDGNTWRAYTSGVTGTVNALVKYQNKLCVGGEFSINVGTTVIRDLACWDETSSSWSGLGSGLQDDTQLKGDGVYSLAVYNNDLYIGGSFTTADGDTEKTRLVRWNGTSYAKVFKSVVDAPVYVLKTFAGDSSLYIGGSFRYVDPVSGTMDRIVRYNGTNFSLVGNSMQPLNGTVYDLAKTGNDIYVVGGSTGVGGDDASNFIARWDDSAQQWERLGNGLSRNSFCTEAANKSIRTVEILEWSGTPLAVLVGGTDRLGSYPAHLEDYGFAAIYWAPNGNGGAQDDAWDHLGSYTGEVRNKSIYCPGNRCGVTTSIYHNVISAIAFQGSNFYIGGYFYYLGRDTRMSYVAMWNGVDFEPLGAGVDGAVHSIYVDGTDVYVGGEFSTAYDAQGNGITNTTYIAKWQSDLKHWVSIGSPGVIVHAINKIDNEFFIAGDGSVRRYDGVTWHDLLAGQDILPDKFLNGIAKLDSTGLYYVCGDSEFGAGAVVKPPYHLPPYSNLGLPSVTTDQNGNYSITGAYSGNTYQISPSKQGSVFSPLSEDITVIGNSTVNFTEVTSQTYSISGFVRTAGSSPMSGVTVYIEGIPSATTDVTGAYSIPGIVSGKTYTVVARQPSKSFAPASQDVTVTGNMTNINFTGASATGRTITGRILTQAGAALGGVAVKALGLVTVYSNTQGYYTLNGAVDGITYRVTPQMFGYGFNPVYLDVVLSGASQTANFTAVNRQTYTISGQVIDSVGNPVSGVTISAAPVLAEDYLAGCSAFALNPDKSFYSWVPLQQGLLNHSFPPGNRDGYAMCSIDGDIWAGGDFIEASDNFDADYITRWQGTNWNAFGTGLKGVVRAIRPNSGISYIAGDFQDAGGSTEPDSDGIAAWMGNATGWKAVTAGIQTGFRDLGFYGNDIFAGGNFSKVLHGAAIDYLARWGDSVASDVDNTSQVASIVDAQRNIHIVYTDETQNLQYRKWNAGTKQWGEKITLSTGGLISNPGVMLSANGLELYLFYVKSDKIYGRMATSPFTQTKWTDPVEYYSASGVRFISLPQIASLSGTSVLSFTMGDKPPFKVMAQVVGDIDGDGVIDMIDTDMDGDGLGNSNESTLGTNPAVKDTDGDGVSDGQEVIDGTNPLDPGSFKSSVGASVCSEWNGFLDLTNIVEHVNLSSGTIGFTSKLYDIGGVKKSEVSMSVKKGGQVDIIANNMTGFAASTYGKVCAGLTKGSAGSLDGRMVYYKSDPTQGYQFAFSMPFGNGLTGTQYVQFNTTQPSSAAIDASNPVANWIQVTNLGTSSETGTLKYYSNTGAVLLTEKIKVSAGGRMDRPAHTFGAGKYGIVEWIPQKSTARFQLRNVRYYYDNALGNNSFDSAYQWEGLRGSGEELVVPLDTRESKSSIEVANVLNSNVNVQVDVYSSTGKKLKTLTSTLKAHSSLSIDANEVIAESFGSAIIKGNVISSLIASSMEVRKTTEGRVNNVYSIQASESTGTVLRGSYNTFLKQQCRLLLANTTTKTVKAKITMTRYSGEVLLNGITSSVGAHSMVDLDLCKSDTQAAYGLVSVQPDVANSLQATVLRIGENEYYRFPTPVR